MAELKVVKSCRGIARASITRLEKHIVKFEDKPELSKVDRQTVQSLIEKVHSLDDTFKELHYIIADEAKDDAVETEQRVFDEHEDKVFSYTNRLCLLLDRSEPAAIPTLATDPSQHLRRRLHEVERELETIKEDGAGLGAETGVDQCLLRQL